MYQIQETEPVTNVLIIINIVLLLAYFGFMIFFIIIRDERNRAFMAKKEVARQQMQAQCEVQEYTMHQLSMELHDNISQMLCTAKNLLTIIAFNDNSLPPSIASAQQILNKAISDMRDLTKSLNSDWLSNFNVVDNIRLEAERLRQSRLLNIFIECSNDKLPLAAKSQIMLFRVLQELLQNSIRHSEASDINIYVTQADLHIFIVYSDNGKGFDVSSTAVKGIGMTNMQHRINMMDGTISWKSAVGSGVEVQIKIPGQHEYL